jgi:hypothetical protein
MPFRWNSPNTARGAGSGAWVGILDGGTQGGQVLLGKYIYGTNPQGPVSTAASLEFGFSQPSYIICESVHADVPWRQDVVAEGFTVEKQGRIVRPNTRPGLGITINETEVAKHPFQQEELQRVFYRDGSVGDW